MKRILIALLFLVLLVFASCGPAKVETTEVQQEASMFVQIEQTTYWEVVYHKETKVLYAVSNGGYNYGTFTVLLNPDGSPMIYKE